MELLLGLGLVLLIIGAFTDIKTREVPDWLNYAVLLGAFGIRGIDSFAHSSWEPVVSGLIGFGIFFSAACLLYYLGQWGGGDAKSLMALGMIFGFEKSISSMLLAYALYLGVAGGIYGIIWGIAIAIKNRKAFAKEWRKQLPSSHLKLSFIIFACIAVAGLFFRDVFLTGSLVLLGLMLPLMIILILFMRAVQNSSMFHWRTPAQLTEGDWIVSKVVINKKEMKMPYGIESKQIAMLRKAKVKKVLVKEGIPFIPGMLLAYIMIILLGSPVQWLMVFSQSI